MVHFFGILEPPARTPVNGQKPFFGAAREEDHLSQLERDVAVLGFNWFASEVRPRGEDERPRFVRMVMPPYL